MIAIYLDQRCMNINVSTDDFLQSANATHAFPAAGYINAPHFWVENL